MRRVGTNLFIAAFLAAILIDGLPQAGRWHGKLKAYIDPVLDATGLWQESWRLFAPEVDKENIRVSAEILYADGSSSRWVSPDWTKMPPWEKFVRFRELEFYDSIRLDANRGAWRSFANYLASTHTGVADRESADTRPVKVTLTRHWAVVPPPRPGDHQPRSAPAPFSNFTIFYERHFPKK